MTAIEKIFDNLEILKCITYSADIRCTSPERLAEKLYQYCERDINQLLKDNLSPLDKLSFIANFFSDYEVKDIKNDKDALLFLVGDSLRHNPGSVVSEIDTVLKDISSLEGYMDKYYGVIKERYSESGLTLNEYPEIILTDQYPKPFNKLKGIALAPDRTDQAKYGIPNALFFRKDRMSLFPGPIILAHELMHSFVNDEGMLARGLEEGLAEFFSYFVICPEFFPEIAIKSHFESVRYNYSGPAQRFKLYTEYMRQAYYLYTKYGMSGLVDLLVRGRSRIKEVELALAAGRINELGLPFSIPEEIISERAAKFSLLFPDNEVVSPTAFLFILNQAKEQNVKIEKKLVEKSINEIEERIFGLIANGNSIEFDDFEHLAILPTLRFEV